MMTEESEIEMVRRHVREGKGHLAKQRAIIVEMQERQSSTVEAERLLVTFEDMQQLHLEHLARLEQGPS